MNMLQIIAVIKLLLDNREQIIELIKLIQSLFGDENLIGDSADATVFDDSVAYPALASAVAEAGMNWSEFIKLLVDNLDELKAIVSSILEVIELFRK
jgi:hypothetical protein